MNRPSVIRRLLYLRNWEFVNIFLLPACLYIILVALEIQNWQPYAYGMFCICVILAQGTYYWHLKLQVIYKNEPALPVRFHQTFSFFKWMNVALLLVYPVVAVFSKMTAFFHFEVSVWPNVLFLFAILEYVNYYHYQLSHDNLNDIRYLMQYKKIRRSPLSIDLQKTAGVLRAPHQSREG